VSVIGREVLKRLDIFEDIAEERAAQDAKFGVQNLPYGTGDEWLQAMADVSRTECDEAFAAGRGTFRHVFLEEVYEAMAETDPVKLRAELIQAIAVGVKIVEAIDRKAAE
jgi:RecB family exonuclease